MGYLERVSGSAIKPRNGQGSSGGKPNGINIPSNVFHLFYVDPTSGKITEGKSFVANKPFWTYSKIGIISQPNTFIVDKFVIRPAGIYQFKKSEIINGKKYHQILA